MLMSPVVVPSRNLRSYRGIGNFLVSIPPCSSIAERSESNFSGGGERRSCGDISRLFCLLVSGRCFLPYSLLLIIVEVPVGTQF